MADDRGRAALAGAAEQEQRRVEQAWAATTAARSWHLVNIGERKSEGTVSDKIKKRLGFEVYVPLTLRARRVPLRKLPLSQRTNAHMFKRLVPAPVFPGYLFVRFSITEAWHDMFQFIGVYGIACENDLPYPLSDAVIERVRAREVNGIIPRDTPVAQLFFKVGERARVTEGVFKGFDCTIEEDVTIEQVDESVPVRCLLALFGRQVNTTLPAEVLQKP